MFNGEPTLILACVKSPEGLDLRSRFISPFGANSASDLPHPVSTERRTRAAGRCFEGFVGVGEIG
jgi:hypothetical protein